MTTRRASKVVALALTALVLLTACSHLPFIGESSNGMKNNVDTTAIAAAITETSASIESTLVDTSLDGLTTRLYVRPVITTDGLTSSELDALLRVAFEGSRGQVSAIEVRTVDGDDEPVDIKTAASGLTIQYLDNLNSVTYSTVYLEKAYAE